jgi:hypothetical protein
MKWIQAMQDSIVSSRETFRTWKRAAGFKTLLKHLAARLTLVVLMGQDTVLWESVEVIIMTLVLKNIN